jgi:hypothetical protein
LLSLVLFCVSAAHADSITQTLTEEIGTLSGNVNFASVFGEIDIHTGIDQLQWFDLYQVQSTSFAPSEGIGLTDIINPGLLVTEFWGGGELRETFDNVFANNQSTVTIPLASPPTFTVDFDGHVYSFPPLSENFIITPTSITQVGPFGVGVPEPSIALLLLAGIFALLFVKRIKRTMSRIEAGQF